MLDEHEWNEIEPDLVHDLESIKEYRAAHGASLMEARRAVPSNALIRYRKITGYPETNSERVSHHRISMFGSPCQTCGKPLRTPKAKFCAACGASVATGRKPRN